MFQKKTWKARQVEFPGRRKLTNTQTGEETTVTVSRAEGSVTEEGDAFTSAAMNDLENRVSEGFENASVNWADVQDKPAAYPPESHAHSAATADAAGFMAAADKAKLDGIDPDAYAALAGAEMIGELIAGGDQAADIAQVRNIVMTDTDPGAGVDVSATYADGTVIHVYE